MRRWERLDAKLAQGIGWQADDLAMAMRLLGFVPMAPGPDAEPSILRFWHLARLGSADPVTASSPPAGLPSDQVVARSELRREIADELDRLDDLRQQIWHERDRLEAEAVARLGLVDTSKEGQLRHRYRREAFSEMTRGLNQVMRLRVERRKDQDRDAQALHPFGPQRRRRAPLGPSTGAGLPNVSGSASADRPAPPAGFWKAPKPPAHPLDSRNEPAESPSAPQARPLNPMSCKEMLPDPPASSPTPDRRTEPRSAVILDALARLSYASQEPHEGLSPSIDDRPRR